MANFEKEELKHLKNLIVVAHADGVLDEFEKQLLCDKAEDFDIPRQEVLALIDNIKLLKFELPEADEDREDELAEVVSISLIDGHLDPREYELCLSFAKRLELNKSDLDMAIKLSHSLWVKSPSYQEQINKFTNLILVAHADNMIDEDEIDFLMEKAKELGIPTDEANRFISQVATLEFTIPRDEEEKEDHLVDIVHLSLIDGELHEREYKLCYSLARRIGFTEDDLNKAIELAKRLHRHLEKKTQKENN